MSVQLVGAAEIGEMLGVSRQRVAQLSGQPDFPQPIAELIGGRVWLRSSVLQWIASRPDRLAYTFKEGTGMFELFTPQTRRIVIAAGEHARRHRSPTIGSIHLLAALAVEPPTASVVLGLGVTPEVLARELAPVDDAAESADHLPLADDARRAIELSALVAQQEGSPEVSPAHLLSALGNPDQPRTHALLSAGEELSARGLDTRIHESLEMTGIACSFCGKRYPRLSVVWQGTKEQPSAAICKACAELTVESFRAFP